MKYALIGCGRISTNHIKAALSNNLFPVALCDIVPKRMEELLTKHGLENNLAIHRYTDYHEMLTIEEPDLVAIATESGNHASIALDCLTAGCNVIIEKPIALSLRDADAICALANEKGLVACACHQNRFNQSIQLIRKAMDKGRFGQLSHGTIHVRWNRGEEYYRQARWRGTWAQDGGALMNQSIHGIDLLRWMMGDNIDEVCSYTAQRQHPYLECEDIGVAIVKFSNGALGTIEGSTNVFPQNLEETLYIFGENGTVIAGGKSTNTIEHWSFADVDEMDVSLEKGIAEKTDNVYGNGHTPLYADVIASILEKRKPYITAEDGRKALELILAVYLSATKGTPVSLPIEECSTMDFLGRFG